LQDSDDTPEDIDPYERANRGRRSGGADRSSPPDLEQVSSDRDQAASDRDQTFSDRDQDTSNREQATADLDQSASDRDQISSDLDQAASEEDQAASDHESVGGVEQRDRDLGSVHREHAAGIREAQVGDRRLAAEDRARAANDRARAVEERSRSAHDRALAARDRAQAALDREASEVDELTHVRRRGPGMRQLQREIDRAHRGSEELIVAFVDVDNLKGINDTEGHPAGDALLRSVADSLRQCLRSYDLIMRYGGDEFVCALPNVDIEDARRRFADVSAVLAAAPVKSSITVGFAEFVEDCPAGELIRRADDDLLARREGR
jgi:diguanylate cyclase (GGDEF)-like protein